MKDCLLAAAVERHEKLTGRSSKGESFGNGGASEHSIVELPNGEGV